jgi:hypothetical protein
MNYPKHLFAFILIFLVISCTEENITNQSNLGNISGRVGYEDPTGFIPLENAIVRIPGASVEVLTDSAGNFLILNLPAGNYNLMITTYGFQTKYCTVSVSAGKTTKAPDIIFTSSSSTYPNYLRWVYLRFQGYSSIYLNMNDTSLVDVDKISGDSLTIIAELDEDFYHISYQDIPLTVQFNSDLYYTETLKGRLLLRLPAIQNFSEIKIWQGHSPQPNGTEFISTIFITDIIDFQIYLNWSTNYNSSAGDCDIHLINMQAQDSCWYKNPHPDWGFPYLESDNPRLYDDTNFYGNYSGNEYLYLDYAPDGLYILKIIYFSNNFNPNQNITADVTLRLDDNYTYYDAPADLSVGQVWTVLKIEIPSKTITLINTIDGPVKQTAAKEVQ